MACPECPMLVFDANLNKDPKTNKLFERITCKDCETIWRKLSLGIWTIETNGKKMVSGIPGIIDIARWIVEGAKIQMEEKRLSHAKK